MSQKNRDDKNRWRNVMVSFRMSPEESQQLNTFVKLSGLTKQDYIIHRLLCKEVIVQGNPRVYKALKEELMQMTRQLERIESVSAIDAEQMETLRLMTTILTGMQGGADHAGR